MIEDTYFMAIPRTGSTSLHQVLADKLGLELVQPHMSIDQLALLDPETREGYSIYAGHYYDAMAFMVQKPLRQITMLRDPLKRTISHYKYLKDLNQIEHETFEDFINDFEWRSLMSNYQAKSFLLAVDPRSVGTRHEVEPDHDSGALGRVMDNFRLMIALTDQELFSKAFRRSKHFFHVGVTEEFKKSTEILFKKLGLEIEADIDWPERNLLPDKDFELGNTERAFRLCAHINQVDSELWEYYRRQTVLTRLEDIVPEEDPEESGQDEYE